MVTNASTLSTTTFTEVFICDPSKDIQTLLEERGNTLEIPISLSQDFFMACLEKVAKKKCPYKYFPKQFKSYFYNNLVLENRSTKDGNAFEVYQKDMNCYVYDKNMHTFHVGYAKKKHSFHMFPSTTCLNNISITKRMTFLINSYTYLNFDIVFNMKNKEERITNANPVYKILINVNSEKNIDIEHSKCLVNEALRFVLN